MAKEVPKEMGDDKKSASNPNNEDAKDNSGADNTASVNDNEAVSDNDDTNEEKKEEDVYYDPEGPHWPRNACVALNFFIKYEEGEPDPNPDDQVEEGTGKRILQLESLYDYGSRCGFWRLYRTFAVKKRIPCTVFGVPECLQNNAEICETLKAAVDDINWEVGLACSLQEQPDNHLKATKESINEIESKQREKIQAAIQFYKETFGGDGNDKDKDDQSQRHPAGIFLGSNSNSNDGNSSSKFLRKLVVEQGEFMYDSDSHSDGLPYWNVDYNCATASSTAKTADDKAEGCEQESSTAADTDVKPEENLQPEEPSGNEQEEQITNTEQEHKLTTSAESKSKTAKKPHLIIPYNISETDIQYNMLPRYPTGHHYSTHLKETLRNMVDDSRVTGEIKMMSVGLSCRLAKPGHVFALEEFIDFAKSYGQSLVWICTREQIADHWYDNYYPSEHFGPYKPKGRRKKVPELPKRSRSLYQMMFGGDNDEKDDSKELKAINTSPSKTLDQLKEEDDLDAEEDQGPDKEEEQKEQKQEEEKKPSVQRGRSLFGFFGGSTQEEDASTDKKAETIGENDEQKIEHKDATTESTEGAQKDDEKKTKSSLLEQLKEEGNLEEDEEQDQSEQQEKAEEPKSSASSQSSGSGFFGFFRKSNDSQVDQQPSKDTEKPKDEQQEEEEEEAVQNNDDKVIERTQQSQATKGGQQEEEDIGTSPKNLEQVGKEEQNLGEEENKDDQEKERQSPNASVERGRSLFGFFRRSDGSQVDSEKDNAQTIDDISKTDKIEEESKEQADLAIDKGAPTQEEVQEEKSEDQVVQTQREQEHGEPLEGEEQLEEAQSPLQAHKRGRSLFDIMLRRNADDDKKASTEDKENNDVEESQSEFEDPRQPVVGADNDAEQKEKAKEDDSEEVGEYDDDKEAD